MKTAAIILLIALVVLPSAVWAVGPSAAGQVRQGLEHFRAGDYQQAARAFAEAEVAEPDDLRITFDQACALAAAGDYAGAIAAFQKSALAEDHRLAARSNYNLGCVDVDQARAALGEKPQAATAEVRQQVEQWIEAAIAHFRNATDLDPEEADALYNTQAARLWLAEIQEVWRKHDAQQARDKLDLIAYLKTLDQRQRALRLDSKDLVALPSSPKRYQAVYQQAKDQGYLGEEIEPLKAKIQAGIQRPPAAAQGASGMPPGTTGAAGPAQPPAQIAPQANPEKALEVLAGLADNAGRAMAAAREELETQTTLAAIPLQAEAVEKLNEVYMVLAPYEALTQTAVERQQELLQQSAQASGKKAAEQPSQEQPTDEETTQEPPRPVDLDESGWNQSFVTDYSQMIRAKAVEGLKNMPPEPAKPTDQQASDPDDSPARATDATSTPVAPKGPSAAEEDPQEAIKRQQEEALKRQEALRKAMQNAVEHAPRVRQLSLEATDLLEQQQPEQALPKQKEALELLKKMLPEQPQNQNQKQQQQDQQKNQQDQQQQQDKKDQNNKEQKDKKQPEQQPQSPKDQDSSAGKRKDEQKEPQQAEKPQDVSQRQAEAVLKKAQQRQQEKRKLDKALQMQLYRPGKVEKDW